MITEYTKMMSIFIFFYNFLDNLIKAVDSSNLVKDLNMQPSLSKTLRMMTT